MYLMLIINEQAVCRKSAMSYDYPPQMGNSSWLSDRGQTLAHFKNHLKRQNQSFIAMWFSHKTTSKIHSLEGLCTQGQQKMLYGG